MFITSFEEQNITYRSCSNFLSHLYTEVFECWIEQDLLPKLKETSVLIMDNATFHKGKRLQELVRCAGHYIVWLPKYSPDLNPIENMWSRVKAIRNKFRVKDIDKLFKE